MKTIVNRLQIVTHAHANNIKLYYQQSNDDDDDDWYQFDVRYLSINFEQNFSHNNVNSTGSQHIVNVYANKIETKRSIKSEYIYRNLIKSINCASNSILICIFVLFYFDFTHIKYFCLEVVLKSFIFLLFLKISIQKVLAVEGIYLRLYVETINKYNEHGTFNSL